MQAAMDKRMKEGMSRDAALQDLGLKNWEWYPGKKKKVLDQYGFEIQECDGTTISGDTSVVGDSVASSCQQSLAKPDNIPLGFSFLTPMAFPLRWVQHN